MQKPHVVLAFGGESSEHDVSVNSAKNIFAAIDTSRYDVSLCYIDTEGTWWLVDDPADTSELDQTNVLSVIPGARTFVTTAGKRIQVDVLMPVLHGKNGEDGSIQGLAQLAHIPIVGCDVLASALSMDKVRTKIIVSHPMKSDVKVAKWITFTNPGTFTDELHDWLYADDQTESDLEERIGPAPWFVKPSRAGSSVGVSKVDAPEDLAGAIKLAFEHDTTVIVEEAIVGREIEVAVLGNPPNHRASRVGEIVPGEQFYSYDDKYSQDSKSVVKLETDIPQSLERIIRQKALKVYEMLDCKGLARVDFFLTPDLEIYLNEVNTFPGFTDISMYPKLWQNEGLSYAQLISELIDLALE